MKVTKEGLENTFLTYARKLREIKKDQEDEIERTAASIDTIEKDRANLKQGEFHHSM